MALDLPKPPETLPPSISRYDPDGTPTRQQLDYENRLQQFLGKGKLAASIGAMSLGVVAPAADMNVAPGTDTPIAVPIPSGIGKYLVTALYALNASISLTTATVGLYTLPAQGGVAIIPQTALSPLTGAAASLAGSAMAIVPATALTAYHNAKTLYLNIGTAQGAAASCDFVLSIIPLSP